MRQHKWGAITPMDSDPYEAEREEASATLASVNAAREAEGDGPLTERELLKRLMDDADDRDEQRLIDAGCES